MRLSKFIQATMSGWSRLLVLMYGFGSSIIRLFYLKLIFVIRSFNEA